MKIKIAFVFLLTISYGYSQHLDKIFIENYLRKSKSIENLDFLIKILEQQQIKHIEYIEHIPIINPLNPKKLKRISRSFSYKKKYHPIEQIKKPHYGIDISAKLGTIIYAPASGIVITNRSSNFGYGNMIKIKHKYGYITRYAHLYLSVVSKNDTIKKGDIIGFVGSTGKSTGNHLHYEIIKNNKHLNPFPFINYK